MIGSRPQPILVTGLPRSGTTWLARELTRAKAVALAGREPMNPRGKQFALSGTLTAWTRLGAEVSPAQRRTLRRVYRGLEPRVYSRYGVRQWAAPLPFTRVVVKDPFALLSLPMVTEITGAMPVILFRHPAALMQSYRRMGWRPATAEMQALGLSSPDLPEPPPANSDPLLVMSWFWTASYHAVLSDLANVSRAVLVDHAELARGGDEAIKQLAAACGMGGEPLGPSRASRPSPRRQVLGGADTERPTLHNFQRTPEDVAESWRGSLTSEETQRMEAMTAITWSELRHRRMRLLPDPDSNAIKRADI